MFTIHFSTFQPRIISKIVRIYSRINITKYRKSMGHRIILELSSFSLLCVPVCTRTSILVLFEGIGKQETRRFVVIIRDQTRAEKVGAVLQTFRFPFRPTTSLPPPQSHSTSAGICLIDLPRRHRFSLPPTTRLLPSAPRLSFSRRFITSLSLPDRCFVAFSFGRDKKRRRKSGPRFFAA